MYTYNTAIKKLAETISWLPLPQRNSSQCGELCWSTLNTEMTLLLVPESILIRCKPYGICLDLIRVCEGLITASANLA